MEEQEITKLKEENEKLSFLLFKSKIDLQMWESFATDYGLDKYGGIRYLREILGDKNEFKNKLTEKYKIY